MDRGMYFILRNLNQNFKNLNRNQRAMFLCKGFPESRCTSLLYWEQFADPEPAIHRRGEKPPSDFSAKHCGLDESQAEGGVAGLRKKLIGWL
jgi:hypothetical protein